MKKIFTLAFSLLCISIYAQYGVRLHYSKQTLSEYDNFYFSDNKDDLFKASFGLGVDYWFRLKQKRLEFLPELGVSYASQSLSNSSTEAVMEVANVAPYFNFNTRIYPFDFGGDCDCPTFSKDGDLLKKGLYISVSPGLIYNIASISGENALLVGNPLDESISFLSYKLSIGAGIDIGLSDFLTINPYVSYGMVWASDFSKPIREKLPTIDPAVESSARARQLTLGIRAAFRFDELNKYGVR